MLFKLIGSFCEFVRRGYNIKVRSHFFTARLGFLGKNVNYRNTNHCRTCDLSRMYLYDNTSIQDYTFITNGGRFIMKKGSGAATGLTIITGNHHRRKGIFFFSKEGFHDLDVEKDVIVEEDVWIGANVTLMAGVSVGRGATVGAGSVCIKSIPPYAVALGNPAKVVGFNFTPEEIIQHEMSLYPEAERIPFGILEKNYSKYFINRLSEIKRITNI